MTEQAAGAPQVLRTRDFVGWDVVDRADDKVGTVADILIDRMGKVRFLDVEFGLPRKHLLIPAQEVEWGDGRFSVMGWTKDELRTLPPFGADHVLDARRLDDLERAYPWLYGTDTAEWRAPATSPRIVPLSEAKEFKIESGAPDLRGWNVFGSDGERLGTVTQLLVDPATLKIRYLDVDLHDDLFALGDDRHVLVPLEQVDLKERGNDVWVRNRTAAEIAALPAYPGGAVRPAMAAVLERVFR